MCEQFLILIVLSDNKKSKKNVQLQQAFSQASSNDVLRQNNVNKLISISFFKSVQYLIEQDKNIFVCLIDKTTSRVVVNKAKVGSEEYNTVLRFIYYK